MRFCVRLLTARPERAYPAHMFTTGLDLKLHRVAARLKQHQVAAIMGVSPSRVAAIERESVVTDATAERYRKAVETCGTFRTSGAVAR